MEIIGKAKRVFNGYTFVIPQVNREDAKYLVCLANKLGIEECISEYLKDDRWNYLTRVCIDENDIGLHLMTMICHYEMEVIKTSRFRRATINDIKVLEKKIAQYKDYEFLKPVFSIDNYKKYLSSLNKEELIRESLITQEIRNKATNIYSDFLNRIWKLEDHIIRATKKKQIDEELVKKCVHSLYKEYVTLETEYNDLHIVNISKNNKTKVEDINSLLERYIKFHLFDKEIALYLITSIRNLFDLYNSRLFVVKYPISLDRYENINKIPSSVVGDIDGEHFNYKSVLEKLLDHLLNIENILMERAKEQYEEWNKLLKDFKHD